MIAGMFTGLIVSQQKPVCRFTMVLIMCVFLAYSTHKVAPSSSRVVWTPNQPNKYRSLENYCGFRVFRMKHIHLQIHVCQTILTYRRHWLKCVHTLSPNMRIQYCPTFRRIYEDNSPPTNRLAYRHRRRASSTFQSNSQTFVRCWSACR